MAIGVIGQKAGMTRLFKEGGISVPCTIIRVIPNRIAQVKTIEKDGYQALQLVGGENKKASRITRPMKGHFRKTSVLAGKEICEFRIADSESKEVGGQIGVEVFSEGQKVRVTGISKGKGFAGTIKRHNFHGQDNSHGNSLSHRVMGSVGQCQFPGRVFKGKKMPGQMGNARVTVKNLEIVKVDKERQLLWIRGAVPGSRNNTVLVRHLSDIDIQAVSPDIKPQPPQEASPATASESSSPEQSPQPEPTSTEQVSEPETASESSPPEQSSQPEPTSAEQVPEPETASASSSPEQSPQPEPTSAEQVPEPETASESSSPEQSPQPEPTSAEQVPEPETASESAEPSPKAEAEQMSESVAPTPEPEQAAEAKEASELEKGSEADNKADTKQAQPPKEGSKDGA